MSDSLSSGRKFRVLNIIEDFNREPVRQEAAFSIGSERVVRILKEAIAVRGKPRKIRMDNGPEFRGTGLLKWMKDEGIKPEFIEPASPQQNAFVERFNRSYRSGVLDRFLFTNLREVESETAKWAFKYTNVRPHDSLGDRTPAEFYERWQNRLMEMAPDEENQEVSLSGLEKSRGLSHIPTGTAAGNSFNYERKPETVL